MDDTLERYRIYLQDVEIPSRTRSANAHDAWREDKDNDALFNVYFSERLAREQVRRGSGSIYTNIRKG